MAEVVEGFPRRRGPGKWAEYFDGRVWKFVRGVDYEIENSLKQSAYQAAHRFKVKITVQVDSRRGEVYIQKIGNKDSAPV